MASELNNIDIVVWNGVITTYSYIKQFACINDDIRIATDSERKTYFSINSANR
jgi:hypothetical protein